MTDNDDMAAIYYAIAKVEATLDQWLREANAEPEETKDEEVSHPITTTKTNRRVYNICKGKMGIARGTTNIALGITLWHSYTSH